MIRAVFLDVGETLLDETRQWGVVADWLAIPRMTFFSAFGAVIALGRHHHAVFDLVAPGVDPDAVVRDMAAQGHDYVIAAGDLYPDALPSLHALRAMGLLVGIAGNQPHKTVPALREAGVEADVIASSQDWGVEKPSPEFFARVIREAGVPADAILYVGDRVDNDVLPARAAGMRTAFIRRGPWGIVQAQGPDAALADARIESLMELPEVVAGLG